MEKLHPRTSGQPNLKGNFRTSYILFTTTLLFALSLLHSWIDIFWFKSAKTSRKIFLKYRMFSSLLEECWCLLNVLLGYISLCAGLEKGLERTEKWFSNLKPSIRLIINHCALADFPAVFFHICHGKQQAVVTPYRAYQNVWAIISDRNELFEQFFLQNIHVWNMKS